MAKNMRKCVVCGEEYEYCPNCPQMVQEPAWRLDFDTENCKMIYDTCAGYFSGHLTKEEAHGLLELCDLSDKDKFTASTKRIIDELMAVPVKKAAVTSVKKVVEKAE